MITDAAESAGFGEVRLVPEPVAAAVYFTEVLGESLEPGSSLVVYDLGAGAFNATVVQAGPEASAACRGAPKPESRRWAERRSS